MKAPIVICLTLISSTISWTFNSRVYADILCDKSGYEACDRHPQDMEHVKYVKEQMCDSSKAPVDANKNCLKELDEVTTTCLNAVDASDQDKAQLMISDALAHKGGATNTLESMENGYKLGAQSFHQRAAICKEAYDQFEKACKDERDAAQSSVKKVIANWASQNNNPAAPATDVCPQVPSARLISDQYKGLSSALNCNSGLLKGGGQALEDRVKCTEMQACLYDKATSDTHDVRPKVSQDGSTTTAPMDPEGGAPAVETANGKQASDTAVVSGTVKGNAQNFAVKKTLEGAEKLGVPGAGALADKANVLLNATGVGGSVAGAVTGKGFTVGTMTMTGVGDVAASATSETFSNTVKGGVATMAKQVGVDIVAGPVAGVALASAQTVAAMTGDAVAAPLNFDPYDAGKTGKGISAGAAASIESAAAHLKGN